MPFELSLLASRVSNLSLNTTSLLLSFWSSTAQETEQNSKGRTLSNVAHKIANKELRE